MMQITKTTELAMAITLEYVNPGDTVVDATCGAGHDTLSLAEAVGEEGKREKAAVLEWAEALDTSKYHVAYVSMLNQKNNPPEILWVMKK